MGTYQFVPSFKLVSLEKRSLSLISPHLFLLGIRELMGTQLPHKILVCIHNTNILTGYIFVIPHLYWVNRDILECQEAIILGFALGISLPDTQVYPHVPSTGGV